MSLLPQNEQWQRLEAGIRAVLDDYDVLDAAIQNGWAGSLRDSLEKKEDMLHELLGQFAAKKASFEVYEIHDLLKAIMLEDFYIDVQDGSLEWMSRVFFSLYKDCIEKLDYSGLQRILERHELRKRNISSRNTPIQVNEIEPEECDGDVLLERDSPGDEEARGDISGPDEEGWTTVRRR